MLQFRDMLTVQCYLYSYLQLQIGQSDWDTYQLKEKMIYYIQLLKNYNLMLTNSILLF